MVIEVISACSIIVMVVVIALCSCWKRDRHKSEWIGLHGMVTQKNPDENVNHLPSVTLEPHANTSEIHTAVDEDDNSKRTTLTATNTRRSLPDIPLERVDGGNTPAWVEPASDNLSELYATVGQYQNSVKRHTLPNGLDSRPSISQHSSISQADDSFSPYARVNYDKVNKKEHPYARVQNTNHVEQDENSSDETVLLRPSTSQTHNEPVAPQRSRRSSAHSGVGTDIPAGTAVAGGIAANEELPYMTPAIAQLNFSGDSQDSSKGYTSISVREPLANIRAQTKEINKLQRDLDPHYSTVSDDSDEMYTTIQEPNQQLYMSGSETYAQIQPPPLTVEVEVNPQPSVSTTSSLERQQEGVSAQTYEAAPQPPSVDSLKHFTYTHSRQASSSSSVGLLGSPKPEKRQANSPLPPPPHITNSPDMPRSPVSKNIDDMYAKVQKNRNKPPKEDPEQALSRGSERSSFHSSRKISNNSSPLAEEEDERPSLPEQLPLKFDDNKYTRKEHDYETLKKQFHHIPDYEKVRGEDGGSEPGYASINGPDSLLSTDPGYEVLKKQETGSEIDPNYEPLRLRSDSAGYSTIPEQTNDGYSVINKQRKMEERQAKIGNFNKDLPGLDEPNYESMPSDYAGVKSTDSESDPNYESVCQNDPNYESVKYLDVNDPPYERLNDDDSTRTDDLTSSKSKDHHSGYETIELDSSNGTDKRKLTSNLPYEYLRDETSKTDSESSDYEKIQNNGGGGGGGGLRPDYETIKPKSLDCSGGKEEPHYDTVNREKSGTSTSEDMPNSDEDIFEV